MNAKKLAKRVATAPAKKAPPQSEKKRKARTSDRTYAAALVRKFHHALATNPEDLDLVVSAWMHNFVHALEAFAANGTWEMQHYRVRRADGTIEWLTREDQAREQLRAIDRMMYERMRARGMTQLDAMASIAASRGVSERTIAASLYQDEPKPPVK